MKKIVLTYGLIASILISGTSTILLWVSASDATHSHSAWIGYLIMVIGLSMIFIGIKQHKDKNLGGVIRFTTAFQVGILITLIASTVYVMAWEVYMATSDSNFMEDYQSSYIENLKSSGAEQIEIDATIEEMKNFAEKYKNPFFRMLMSLMEIFPVGLIITLISSYFLRSKTTGK